MNASSGDSHWVFESAPQPNEPGGKVVSATDKRFFWLALYAQPGLWVALAIVAIVRFEFIWLTLVGKWKSWDMSHLRGGRMLICAQSLLLSSRSQTLLLSRGATSSVKRVECWNAASTAALWRGISVALWFRACSTGVEVHADRLGWRCACIMAV